MSTPRTHTERRVSQLLAFAALCAALVVAAVAIPSAGASSAKVIGKTKHAPGPACPADTAKDPCSGVGRVTGFMTVADGKKHPFNVFKDGKIVAFAIDLSKPTKDQRKAFAGYFGNKKYKKAPTARLAVIKHTSKKGKHEYKLLRQSPVVKLGGALGQKQVFTLDRPLRVRKGQVVALTYPTWASNFAVRGLSAKGNQWRASRQKGKCSAKHPSNPASVNRFTHSSHPQQKVGSTHTYGCLYTAGRILYWAYYVPDKK